MENKGKLSNFEILNKLGSGAYSSVYKVQRKSDQKTYALKQVKLMDMGDREKQNALNEVRFIASIRHENIVSYKECFIEDNNLCIIMEYAEGGDLLQKIQKCYKKQQIITELEIWQVAIQILQGLRALHRKKILHRDLKCANIFIYANDQIKLGDFNVSKLAKNGMVYTQTGTPYYASPEVWQDKPYDHKADIWSLGCVLYEACCLKPPFRAKDMDGLYKQVLKGQYHPIPAHYSSELSQLIKSMMQIQPQNRPDSDQILTTSYVQRKAKQYSISIQSDDIEDDLLKTIKWPIIRKGLSSNKSELLNIQLPASNYLNYHNSNHLRKNQTSNRIKSSDNNESINQPSETLQQLMKQITQLEQKDNSILPERSPLIQYPLNKSISKPSIQDFTPGHERRLRVSNSTHEKHERQEQYSQLLCASKDRTEPLQNYIPHRYYSKLPLITNVSRCEDESLIRKNSNERNSNNSNYIAKFKHENSLMNIKREINLIPSAERPSALMKIVEEHEALPKILKKRQQIY